MAIHTLGQLFAQASPVFKELLRDSTNSAAWNSQTIAKEGREPELQKLRALYDKLKDVHERSMFADEECLQRIAVLVTAQVFSRTEAPTANDKLIEHVGGMPPLKWSTNWDDFVPFSGGPSNGRQKRQAGSYRLQAPAG